MEWIGPSWEGLEKAIPIRPNENSPQQSDGLVDGLHTPLWMLAQVLLQEFGQGVLTKASWKRLRHLGQSIPEGSTMGLCDGRDRQIAMEFNKLLHSPLGLCG
jgi:hypothetical protein